ncbi:hypothetical protein LCGC14_0660510 [marine sediment metagenome]|uniref:Uncharacterized protein n=1 Tax=marine sediment metagenome TaxID=412755 RepID=A0A0F9RDP0_9ZZZZ
MKTLMDELEYCVHMGILRDLSFNGKKFKLKVSKKINEIDKKIVVIDGDENALSKISFK